MQRIVHTTAATSRITWRAAGLLFAGLLQAGFVWALVVGLDVKDLVQPLLPAIDTFFVKDRVKPATPPLAVRDVETRPVVVPIPTFVVETPRPGSLDDTTTVIHGPVTAGPADHGPVSVMATHTIPPYPPLDIHLGNQGTVLLRLLIGVDGRVLDAKVARSSGSESLDRAAQSWVMARWRYQPAIRGGAAVQGVVDVAVKFDLKSAG
jgi:protein TonB